LGIIISTVSFVFGLGRIVIMIYRNKPKRFGKYRIVQTPKAVVPFLLFKWIIINPEKYSSNDMEQVIAHERMHAFQLHSLDLIIIEVLVILFWFNPFIYWYRKSIREVHEYLADQAVVGNGHDQLDYQKLLLNHVVGCRFIGLTSSFSYSLSKNRLKMLSMIKSKNTSKIKIALAIPFIASFIMFFTNCKNLNSEKKL
jgi:beta-lactamase regulating signal transducer with metallopeptidase domain